MVKPSNDEPLAGRDPGSMKVQEALVAEERSIQQANAERNLVLITCPWYSTM